MMSDLESEREPEPTVVSPKVVGEVGTDITPTPHAYTTEKKSGWVAGI